MKAPTVDKLGKVDNNFFFFIIENPILACSFLSFNDKHKILPAYGRPKLNFAQTLLIKFIAI